MTNYINEDDVSREMSPLVELLLSDQGDHDHEWRYCIEDNDAINKLKKSILMRDGSNEHEERFNIFSHSFITQQAVARYFEVMAATLKSLNEMFSLKQITLILNSNPTPYWDMHSGKTLSSMLIDDQGIESLSDLDGRDDLKLTIQKLQKLTAAQNMALADVCERFWRNTSNGDDYYEIFSNLGLQLKKELH